MVSYKRDVSERKSLSEVKMGRGTAICERVHEKIVENFKNNVPRCQIAKALQISSSTVDNIFSKDSEKLEKSLHVRDKAEDLCWMPVVFGPLDNTASLIDMILSFDITKWAQKYFQKPLSVNTIRRAICRCQLNFYHAKRKPYVNTVQKYRRVLWAKAHLKWTFKVEMCSMVRRVQI